MALRRGERIPVHDHADFNSGGRLSANAIDGLATTSESTSTTTSVTGIGFGVPSATGTALVEGSSGDASRADHVHTNAYLGTVLTYGSAVANYVLTAQSAGSATWAAAAGGASLIFHDEGSTIGTPTVVDFVGAGVAATYSGGTATVTISGGTTTASIVTQDEGSTIGTASVLNFVGAGVTATYSGGTATATISGGGGSGVGDKLYLYANFR